MPVSRCISIVFWYTSHVNVVFHYKFPLNNEGKHCAGRKPAQCLLRYADCVYCVTKLPVKSAVVQQVGQARKKSNPLV
jgi:hypothetical protein